MNTLIHLVDRHSWYSRIAHFFALDKHQRKAKRVIGKRSYPKRDRIVLVEAWQPGLSQLALSFFLPALLNHLHATPVNYYMMPRNNYIDLKERIRHHFSVSKTYGIHRMKLFGPRPSNWNQYLKEAEELIAVNSNPLKFEKLCRRGIRIGDLVYDQYLRASKNPTLIFSDPLLVLKLAECISYQESLENYFDSHHVVSVCVSHTMYHLGLPTRIATARGIDSFQVNALSIDRINRDFPQAYTDFKLYPETFRKFPKIVSDYGLAQAEIQLQSKLTGDLTYTNIDESISIYSYLQTPKHKPPDKNNLVVLVAVHDFFDAVHVYGDNLFPDLMCWLNFLAEIASQTNYSWWLKIHPYDRGVGEKILQDFVLQNSKFILLPKATATSSVINYIDIALTINGTIAIELAFLGKPVLNASTNNPHSRYGFSLSPNSIAEYRQILLNLSETLDTFVINRGEVLEYYAVHSALRLPSWLVTNIRQISKQIGYSSTISWEILDYVDLEQDIYPREKIDKALSNFLRSSDPALNLTHWEDYDLILLPK